MGSPKISDGCENHHQLCVGIQANAICIQKWLKSEQSAFCAGRSGAQNQAESRLRPLALLERITALPPRVAMRARKP